MHDTNTTFFVEAAETIVSCLSFVIWAGVKAGYLLGLAAAELRCQILCGWIGAHTKPHTLVIVIGTVCEELQHVERGLVL